jgi:uncharacterized Fe-S cluster protein YjdI
MKVVKKYSNGEISIIWKPKLCVHSEHCFKGLPMVFNPKEKPWIKPGNASTKELMEQVRKCPSGALSWEKDVEI